MSKRKAGSENGGRAVPPSKSAQWSGVEPEERLKWLIAPVEPEVFQAKHWEQQPLLVARDDPSYYSSIFSIAEFKELLDSEALTFEKDIDITSYKDGKRETHNGTGVAAPKLTWSMFEDKGCSLRLLCPQAHSTRISTMLAQLEAHWGMFTGSNMYLTPAGTQGFAPHYDDIEAFVLQLEGSKHWRVYAPRNMDETLPRFSSGNFVQEEIGEPILEAVLNPGDLLYFPRGFIHQADSVPGKHSLHITVSTGLHNNWFDFLQLLLPAALGAAASEDPSFRMTLPRDYLSYMGVVHAPPEEASDEEEEVEVAGDDGDGAGAGAAPPPLPPKPEAEAEGGEGGDGSDLSSFALLSDAGLDPVIKRQHFVSVVMGFLDRIVANLPFDATADQMARQFMHQRLPPALTPEDKVLATASFQWADDEGSQLDPDSLLRVTKPGAARLTVENGRAVLYHPYNNSLRFMEDDESRLEFHLAFAPILEALLTTYPAWLALSDLPLDTEDLEAAAMEAAPGEVEVVSSGALMGVPTVLFKVLRELVDEGVIVVRR